MGYTISELPATAAERLDKAFGVKDALVVYNPGKCLMPPFFEQMAQQILDAEVRKDDVWLVSFPRTGSTWCQEMIWLLGNDLDFEGAKNTIQQIRAPVIESSTALAEFYGDTVLDQIGNSVEFVKNMKSPRYIKSHLPINFLPTQWSTVKPKTIYLCRNPKDMCVSYYHHCKILHHMNVTFEEFCDLLLNDLTPLGSVWNHYLNFWKRRDDENFLFLKYEDMKSDVQGTLRKLASFLGKEYTDAEYNELSDFLSFQKMRENKSCNFQLFVDAKMGKDYYKNVGTHFIRKGIVGDWKNHMSPELSKRFDDWIEENTRGTGLSFDME